MKPPVTVEAKVAEELRNWLASELEQLDASNTNQFAHHVVTILLHEDLDIEDEPLTAGDDFLRDIYSIKQGKTRERQKKAAVQFLRSAVCCDDPGEVEIQGVVDELMVKIEETKSKMDKKRSSKRSLLAPIAINVEYSANQTSAKSDGSEDERRYNEAFPSLSGEDSPCKDMAAPVKCPVWKKSPPPGKENEKKGKWRHVPSAHKMSSFFSCQAEAQACNIARQVAASALAEDALPHAEVADILPTAQRTDSSPSFTNIPSCWKSAFHAVQLTKIFIPKMGPLKLDNPVQQVITSPLTVFSPKVIAHGKEVDNLTNIQMPADVDVRLSASPSMNTTGFHHIEERDFQVSPELDSEVAKIMKAVIERGRKYNQENKFNDSKTTCAIDEDTENWTSELDEVKSFPSHYGDFFTNITLSGKICLYPEITRSEMEIPQFVQEHITQGNQETSSVCSSGSFQEKEMVDKKSSMVWSYSDHDDDLIASVAQCCTQFMPEIKKLPEESSLLALESDGKETLHQLKSEARMRDDCSRSRDRTSPLRAEASGCSSTSSETIIMPCGYRLNDFTQVNLEVNWKKHKIPDMKQILEDINKTAVICGHPPAVSAGSAYVSDLSSGGRCSSDSGCSGLSDAEINESLPVTRQIYFSKTVGGQRDGSDLTYSRRDPIQNNYEVIESEEAAIAYSGETGQQLLSVEGHHWSNPFSLTSWDIVSESVMIDFREKGKLRPYDSPPNLFAPSRFTSCLSTEGNKILERAFINSVFSDNFRWPLTFEMSHLFPLHCSELEQRWLNMDGNSAYEAASALVRGRTCSNWLENNCTLGLLCPFSHPSI